MFAGLEETRGHGGEYDLSRIPPRLAQVPCRCFWGCSVLQALACKFSCWASSPLRGDATESFWPQQASPARPFSSPHRSRGTAPSPPYQEGYVTHSSLRLCRGNMGEHPCNLSPMQISDAAQDPSEDQTHPTQRPVSP